MPVTALDIHARSLVLDGRPFGAAGAYEKLAGTVHFAVDPTHRLNAVVTDLKLAPRGADGRVAFQSDFYLLRPVDPARGNRRLLLDVPNRGRKVALGMFNSAVRVPDPTTAEDFGNGFLMRHGYTVAWVGWQHDVPRLDGMMALDVPRAPGVSGLRALRVPAEHAHRRAAAGRSLPRALRRGGARRPRGPDDWCASTPALRRWRSREARGALPAARRSARARCLARVPRGRLRRGHIYDARLSLPGSADRGAGVPGRARHRGVPDAGAVLRRATRARVRSIARCSSACRRAAASCATCCTSASTRTSRGAWSSTR